MTELFTATFCKDKTKLIKEMIKGQRQTHSWYFCFVLFFICFVFFVHIVMDMNVIFQIIM